MTESRRPTPSAGTGRLPAAPGPAEPRTAKGVATGARRRAGGTRRRRIGLTLAAAAAGFVIVFQFLALQLQGGRDPAIGATAAPIPSSRHAASAPATAGSSPVVTRASGGAQSVAVSGGPAVPSSAAGSPSGRAHRPIHTGASGSGRVTSESDDLQ